MGGQIASRGIKGYRGGLMGVKWGREGSRWVGGDQRGSRVRSKRDIMDDLI